MPLEFWGLFLNWIHVRNTLINNPGEATLEPFFYQHNFLFICSEQCTSVSVYSRNERFFFIILFINHELYKVLPFIKLCGAHAQETVIYPE